MAAALDFFPNQNDPAIPLDLQPVAGNIGAQVDGITLSAQTGADEITAIRAALTRHKVLFFRGQALDGAALGAFAELLDVPYTHPIVRGDGRASVTALEAAQGYAASSWHVDVSFAAAYPRFSILHGVDMPRAGGDTLWANTATAYDSLPEDFKELADRLWAFHDNRFDYSTDGRIRELDAYRSAFAAALFQTEHPLVHVHPDSGEHNLLGGSYLKRFVGYGESASHHLRAIVQDAVTNAENTVRWRWQSGDVAIWDNAATQHRAIGDFGTQRRSLRRATAGSFTPMAIDGRSSRTVTATTP